MPSPHAVTTVVLRKDGLHHVTVKGMSAEDAHRWAESGFNVFQLAVAGREWAVHHVNSGRVMTSADRHDPEAASAARDILLRLEMKGDG